MDVNDDEGIDVADAIAGLSYMFSSGPAPAAPFPDCGGEPGTACLSCLMDTACP